VAGALNLPHSNSFGLFLCVSAVFLACSVTTQSQLPPLSASSAATGEVQVAEEAFRQAQLKYDTSSAASLLADEFVGTWNHAEQADKKQFLSLIGDQADPLEILEYGEMNIRLYGDTAVVWSSIQEKAVYDGKVDEYRGRRTAIWVKRNMRWQCVTIHTSAFK
jgi:hypothetical protein